MRVSDAMISARKNSVSRSMFPWHGALKLEMQITRYRWVQQKMLMAKRHWETKYYW